MAHFDEKELIELSNEIIHSLTKLVLGEKPGFLAGSVYKKMEIHPRLSTMKSLYASFVMDFKGLYEDAASLKKLTDFRYEIVELFDSESPIEH
jgi:hypothetical protein